MQSIREKAKELMRDVCRVCPVCDGRACAGEVPGMGGIGTGESFKRNVRALADLSFNMRLIHDAAQPDTAARWLGFDLSMPVIAAPIGGTFNYGNGVTEAEYARAVLEGSRKAGVVGCTGDGVPPELLECGVAAIVGVGGVGIPFIKPWEGEKLAERMERALSSGCSAMGMDIDAAGLTTLRKMGHPVSPKPVKELAAIVDKAHARGVKFIIKGVMTPEDARLSVEAGADAIVVSNHGGRILQSTPGTASVLPGIAEAVKGRIAIMADGGVRTGFDVLKMLALGADVVGIGRPVTIAAIGGGGDGVAAYFEKVRAELVQGMVLTGCGSLAGITPDILFAGA